MSATLENIRRIIDGSQERHDRLMALIDEAIKSGKPVCIGVWGPTGQEVYVVGETRTTTV